MKIRRILGMVITVIVIGLSLFFISKLFIGPATPDILEDDGKINLYFTTANALSLAPEEREITGENIYEKTIQQLIKGPQISSLGPTIPEGVKILSLKVKDGTAFVNFNNALKEKHWGGSTGERMTVYSIVNTLTQFKSIDRVQILLDSKKVETLSGHMDLSDPLSANEDIIEKNKNN